jgi:hypothetical protein
VLWRRRVLLLPARRVRERRPLLDAEIAANEWDVIGLPEPHTLTVHEGRVAQSGRRLALHLAHYSVDAVTLYPVP